MTQSSCRLQLRPKTEIDALVFSRLKQGSSNVSAKGTRAISTHYLAEIVAQIDPYLDNPKLRIAVIEAKHELESRLNLIESLFPALAPATPPPQPIWLSPHEAHSGPVQPELRVVSEPSKRYGNQAQQKDFEGDNPSESVLRSDSDVDPLDLSWSDFSMS